MRLRITHAHIFYRSCESCQTWQYDEKTGQIETLEGTDEKLPRHDPELVPCKAHGMSCPKISPEHEITNRNLICLDHYHQCKAVGEFPDDSIVKQNAGIIAEAEREAERSRSEHQQLRFMSEFAKCILKTAST